MSKPRRNPKILNPTHNYMGNLFCLLENRIYIFSFMLNKWQTLWKSFDHDELVLLFNRSNRFRIPK